MIGSGELIVILCLGLLLFGGKKLPEFARNLGKGIREFKRACNGEEETIEVPPSHLESKSTQPSDSDNNHPTH
jgi:sec-independent protein translocase protein TatA